MVISPKTDVLAFLIQICILDKTGLEGFSCYHAYIVIQSKWLLTYCTCIVPYLVDKLYNITYIDATCIQE